MAAKAGIERQQIGAMVNALERLAVANEKIVELATDEREIENTPGPPYCPNCGAIDPKVTSEGGSGTFGSYVLVARCGSCHEMIFAVPNGWTITRSSDEAETVRRERAGETDGAT